MLTFQYGKLMGRFPEKKRNTFVFISGFEVLIWIRKGENNSDPDESESECTLYSTVVHVVGLVPLSQSYRGCEEQLMKGI